MDLFDGIEPSLSMLSNAPLRRRRTLPFDAIEQGGSNPSNKIRD